MEEGQGLNDALLATRFDATIHPGSNTEKKDWADALDVDRVPASNGEVRALLTLQDLVRLLEQGLEVRLFRAYGAEPLNPALIMPDEVFKNWLDDQVNTLKAKPDPKPLIDRDL
jgi:hypothetical protein